MENTTQIGKGIYYSHLEPGDKHYFGGFFNLAQININGVAKEFCTRMGSQPKGENYLQAMKEYFSPKISLTDWERGSKVLQEYWPVMQFIDLPVTDEQFKKLRPEMREAARRNYFATTLNLLLTAIDDYRNYYTHYFHEPVAVDNALFTFLDKVLLNVAVDELKNKLKNDKTRQLLKEGIARELEILRKLKYDDLKKKQAGGKKVSLKPDDIENAIYNDAFGHIIYRRAAGESYQLKDFRLTRADEKSIASTGLQLSESGLIFLLSVFLSRKEVEQLKSNIKGYKEKVRDAEKDVTLQFNSLKFMATHWVYSRLAFKGLKQRLTTGFEKETLLMQLMDELSKVPDEVYRTLSDGDKKQFVEDMNEYWSDTKANDEGLYVVHPVIRKRYESKFNYFALRYLDEFGDFTSLRFQVFAGQYVHDSRSKAIAGGTFETQRIIKEKINVFGKLSEVSNRKSDFFAEQPDEQGWEFFPNPSYNWVGNNIPVYIDLSSKSEDAKKMLQQVLAYRQQVNPPKERKLRCNKANILKRVYPDTVKWGDPTFLLSAHELMPLLYELLVKGKTGAELEDMLVEKLVERFQLLQAYEPDGEKRDKSVVPPKLQAGDKECSVLNVEKLSAAIKEEVKRTVQKQEMIKQHRSELNETANTRKKNPRALKALKVKRNYLFYASEMGQEASWLADDIIRFMPLDSRALWKGYHHSELQRLLAYYDYEHQSARTLIESVWKVLPSDRQGTAVMQCFQNRNFEGFYTEYLDVRKARLIDSLELLTDEEMSDDARREAMKQIFVGFERRLYRIKATDKQKAELLAKPMAFPRGLFDGKPTVIEGVSVNDAPAQFADWYSSVYHYPGNFQSYYTLCRDYRELFEQYKQAGKFNDWENKSRDEMLERFRLRCDQSIRKVKFQDVYLKLMVDALYQKVFGQLPDFDLSMMYDTAEERRQNNATALLQKDRAIGDDSENLRKENYILNKTFTVSLYNGQIKEPKVKLKDVGKFRRFAADSKVLSLLSYAPERVWTKEDIENELENRSDSYEAIRRTELLKNVHQFERLVLQKHGFDGYHHPHELLQGKYPNFKMYICKGFLPHLPEMETAERDYLLQINFQQFSASDVSGRSVLFQKACILIFLRNKFGHNQLPNAEQFQLMTALFPKQGEESYSGYFNRITSQIIDEFVAAIS